MNNSAKKIIQIISAIALGLSFFLHWVNWDGSKLPGKAMANGDFFAISESRFDLANPFPGLSFMFYAFWLIPVLAFAIPFLVNRTKPYPLLSFIAGSMSLALVTTYILFSRTLLDLGAGDSLMGMLKPGIFIHAAAAIALIITAFPVKNLGWKTGWLLIGPVVAFVSFKMIEKLVMEKTHAKTETVVADFKMSSEALINEFISNDTAANRKYLEKVLEVNGSVAGVDILPDSSGTIKFADSTGSYAIFSFEKEQLAEVKSIAPGEMLTVKGVCSGSIYSEILGTTSISFKRSTLIKQR